MKHALALAALLLAACAAPAAEPTAPPEEASASSTTAEAPATYATLSGEKPIIIAHRGASGLFPEHTIAGYQAAIEQGADFIEPDLVMTKDGVLIARHDAYLSDTTDVADHPEFADRKVTRATPMGDKKDWWADDFTLAEIKTLKARQQFPTRTKEHDGKLDIVTFDEVMDVVLAAAADGRVVGLHIEAKWPGYYSSVGLDMVDPIIEGMKAKGLAEAGIPVFIQSFEPEFLTAFAAKSDLPTIQNMVGEPYASMMGLTYDLETLKTAGVGAEKTYILNADGTTTDFVEKAHAKGLLVHVYTVRDDQPMPGYENAQAELNALIKAGADGIWVDYPDAAVAVRDGH